MTSSPPDVPASYELRIGGHLDQHWSTWFDGFTITHQDDGTTTLRGAVRDQSDLHGLLAKVRDLGTTLISLRHLEAPDTGADHDTGGGAVFPGTATSLSHRS
jgi:hypothetical protein